MLIPMILSQKSIKLEHPSIISVIQASEILFVIILENICLTSKLNHIALIGSILVLISIVIVSAQKLWQDRRKRTATRTLIHNK